MGCGYIDGWLIDLESVMEMEFVFMNDGEFGNPCYVVSENGNNLGVLKYRFGQWYCSLSDNFMYGDDVFFAIGLKIEDLNESLEKQRKEYFGLI